MPLWSGLGADLHLKGKVRKKFRSKCLKDMKKKTLPSLYARFVGTRKKSDAGT